LEETNHNSGGIHAFYRTIKTFLRWYENETEPENWCNPINKIKSPKVPLEQLEPATIQDISSLIATCKNGTFTGARDKAILLSLLDTGARSQKFLDINLADINLLTGEILIRHGKGRKPRFVYLGRKSRKAVRNYLKFRIDNHPALWINHSSERLAYDGLRSIVTRRSTLAGIKPPSLHSFRRSFALNMLRSGANIYSLQAILGHTSLSMLTRYIKITSEDTKLIHRLASPVDNNMQ
jgi:site-specific recombinase XerD